MPKMDSGMKFDRAKIDRILALSLELTNWELSEVVKGLTKMSNDRTKSIPSLDNTDTISV